MIISFVVTTRDKDSMMPSKRTRILIGILGVTLMAGGAYLLIFFFELINAPCAVVRGECGLRPVDAIAGIFLGLLNFAMGGMFIGKAIKWW